MKQGYRADVDGLRAVAVLSVFAGHLKIPYFEGGFVGVDIFFVISGFLITGLLLPEAMAGQVRFGHFYQRRIRRIIPALLVMLLAVVAVGWFTLLPFELADLGRSALASLFSASNIFFWSGAGYFQPSEATRPLLHTWSLAVEEQFYLLYPLLLAWLARRFPDRLGLALGCLALISFLTCVAMTPSASATAFYLAPFRAWELLLGGLLHFLPCQRVSSTAATAVSVLAMVILGWSILNITPQGFPGWIAAVPVTAAAALIHVGAVRGNFVSRLLALPPVRGIGLISYSLYLWHWPLIVLNTLVDPLGLGVRLSHRLVPIVLVAFTAATLSWWFVERPFRDSARVSWPRVAWSGALASALIVGTSLYLLASDGAAGRWMPQARYLAGFLDPKSQRSYDGCFLVDPAQTFPAQACLSGQSRGGVLLVGDSHAAHLAPGFRRRFADDDVSLVMAVGCRNLGRDRVPEGSACGRMRGLLDDWLLRHRPALIVISGRWREGDFEFLRKVLPMLRANSDRVVLIGSQLEYNLAPPRVLAQQAQRGGPGLAGYRITRFDSMQASLARIAKQADAEFLAPVDVFCGAKGCLETVDGDPVYFDTDGHLTQSGAIWFSQHAWPIPQANR